MVNCSHLSVITWAYCQVAIALMAQWETDWEWEKATARLRHDVLTRLVRVVLQLGHS